MIRIGIICPSEIAARRFLPALRKAGNICFAGVAIADKTEFKGATDVVIEAERAKAQAMIDNYGGRLFESYHALITSDEVDAVYLPLPPGLHYQWAKQALEADKHILVEKPATTSLTATADLIELAREKKLAVHENYMFVFHKQIQEVNDIVARLAMSVSIASTSASLCAQPMISVIRKPWVVVPCSTVVAIRSNILPCSWVIHPKLNMLV